MQVSNQQLFDWLKEGFDRIETKVDDLTHRLTVIEVEAQAKAKQAGWIAGVLSGVVTGLFGAITGYFIHK